MTRDDRAGGAGLGEGIEGVLRGAGLTDEPGKYDGDMHSWRCAYPDVYGPCSCFQELRDDLVRVVAERTRAAEAAAAHLAGIFRHMADEPIDGLQRMTWRAALLAAAQIVEEDATLRGAVAGLEGVGGAEGSGSAGEGLQGRGTGAQDADGATEAALRELAPDTYEAGDF